MAAARLRTLAVASVQTGAVDQLLDAAVERAALQQLEVEVGSPCEHRLGPTVAADDRENRDLHAVDEPSSHERLVHRQAAVGTQGNLGLLLQASDNLDGVAARQGRVRPVERGLER